MCLHLDTMAAEALTFVNSVRAGYGKPPLKRLKKGTPGDAHCCVMSESLRVCAARAPRHRLGDQIAPVASTHGHTRIGADGHAHPFPVRAFVSAFDMGDYPHLVKVST